MDSKRALALVLDGPELGRGTKPVQRGTLNCGLSISYIIKYDITFTMLPLVYRTHYP